MSKESRRKPGKKVWFWRGMPRSPAFLKLTGKAPHVLLILHTKFQMWRPKGRGKGAWEIWNNGELQFTYREAQKLGIRKGAFTRAIDQLLRFGFIDIARRSAGLHRSTTLYAVSERWRKFGTSEFEERQRPKDMRVPGFFGRRQGVVTIEGAHERTRRGFGTR